ncbi:MAG: hypothetical protein NTX25_15000 [Proteobacteria bacterium]|nr:hypothetical protein [Pseudomonadota bacterium]
MSRLSVLGFGLFLAHTCFAPMNFAFADVSILSDETLTQTLSTGSCEFQGQYSSGCMEFQDANWTEASMLNYCQKNSKAGASPVISQEACPKADFNTLCAGKSDEGLPVNIYVNNLPSFICKKYMNGTLSKRPDAGW